MNKLNNGQLITLWIEVDGRAVPIYFKNGRYWVEAQVGKRYEIVITNRSRGRIEVLESVDGRNVLEDETADYARNTGMVVGPGATWHNAGWRLSDSEIRDFVFSDPQESIAKQATGTAKNVGVIGLAIFEERIPEPAVYRGGGTLRGGGTPRGLGPDVFSSGLESTRGDVGTGMGQRRTDVVGRTQFTRRTTYPVELFEIQYRSRAWLEEHGIIDDDEPSAWPEPDPTATGYEKY